MTDAAHWHEFAYEQTDIPAEITIREWRMQRARTRALSGRWARIIRALLRRHRGDAARRRANGAPPDPDGRSACGPRAVSGVLLANARNSVEFRPTP